MSTAGVLGWKTTSGVDRLFGMMAPADVLQPVRGRVQLVKCKAEKPSVVTMTSKGVCNVIDVAGSGTPADDPSVASGKNLPDAAQRALREAAERRVAGKAISEPRQREVNGRQGPEPVRYGDWENKGIASDF